MRRYSLTGILSFSIVKDARRQGSPVSVTKQTAMSSSEQIDTVQTAKVLVATSSALRLRLRHRHKLEMTATRRTTATLSPNRSRTSAMTIYSKSSSKIIVSLPEMLLYLEDTLVDFQTW